jgi:hypothetical protein
MTKIRSSLGIWPLVLVLPFVGVLGTTLQSDLQYRDRGDRYEGVRSFPISDKIELLSAMVDYEEPVTKFPDYFKLRFYLNENAPVSLTVREINNRSNYWLDKVKKPAGWHLGFNNEFQWPTDEVIKPLKNIGLYDLGTVVELSMNTPESEIQVAPSILFHSQPPKSVNAYLFSFKVGRRAEVTWHVSKDDARAPDLETSSVFVRGGVARTIRWNAANMKDGRYQLRITISFTTNGQRVSKVIHFYHRNSVDN